MSAQIAKIGIRSRPKITLMMVLCGIVSAASAQPVEATRDREPGIAIKYDPQSLATDRGVRILYGRLLKAAEEACPDRRTGTRLISPAIQHCRAQAVARAVQKINSPRLAQYFAASAKSS